MTLSRFLIFTGLAILAFSLWKLWRITDPLPEYSPFPPGLSTWRLEMEMARVQNGTSLVAKEDTKRGKC